jgi:transposase-like protein
MKRTPIVRHYLTIGGAFIMAKFTVLEKLHAVKRYLNGTETQKAIADSIGVSKPVLRTWIQQYVTELKPKRLPKNKMSNILGSLHYGEFCFLYANYNVIRPVNTVHFF